MGLYQKRKRVRRIERQKSMLARVMYSDYIIETDGLQIPKKLKGVIDGINLKRELFKEGADKVKLFKGDRKSAEYLGLCKDKLNYVRIMAMVENEKKGINPYWKFLKANDWKSINAIHEKAIEKQLERDESYAARMAKKKDHSEWIKNGRPNSGRNMSTDAKVVVMFGIGARKTYSRKHNVSARKAEKALWDLKLGK